MSRQVSEAAQVTVPHRKIIPFAGCFTGKSEKSSNSDIVFVGLPADSQSSYRRGCSQAPNRIRLAYDGNCYNSCTESGVDLARIVQDLGDLQPVEPWESTARKYRDFAANLFREGKTPFFAGGDHAVTVPVVEALQARGQPVHVIQIDAHPDLYPAFEGNPNSHGSVAARMLDMTHVVSITQMGIRTLNSIQEEHSLKFRDRLHMVLAAHLGQDLPALEHIPRGACVYLTVDLDAFDPAFAPGVAHPVPGGLTSRQVLQFIVEANWKLLGMDVVEVNPMLDANDQTAILAARLLHEGMGYAKASQREEA